MRTFRPSRRVRPRDSHRSPVLAGLTVLASVGAFASPAQALTTTHVCQVPFVDDVPVTLTTTPRTDPAYVVDGFTLEVGASVQLGADLTSAFASVGGSSVSMATTLSLGGPTATSPFQPVPASGPLVVEPPFRFGRYPANDYSPAITFSLSRLAFTVVARDADGQPIRLDPAATSTPQTDGDPNTLQIDCSFSPPTQDKVLISVRGSLPTPPPTPTAPPTPTSTPIAPPTPTSTPIAPPTPTPDPFPAPTVTVSDIGEYGATLCFTGTLGPFDAFERGFYVTSRQPDGFSATKDPFYPAGADGCVTITNLRPGLPGVSGVSYRYYLVAREANGDLAKISTNGSFTTATPAATPAPPLFYGYAVTGAATLKTLTRGSLPLSGSLVTGWERNSGQFSGTLELAPTSGSLTTLGFLPVQARVEFVSAPAAAPGTMRDGSFSAVAKVRIKVPSVTVFGLRLAGGASCQAKQISSITLTNTEPTFSVGNGGSVAGTFAISDLAGCGYLTGIVSPLTQGASNAIALKLGR